MTFEQRRLSALTNFMYGGDDLSSSHVPDPSTNSEQPMAAMKSVKRNGVALAYRDLGSGVNPIILVHGWAGDHSFMQPQMEHLCQYHRVLAVDLCGHGQSAAPERKYTLADFAEDIHWLSATLSLPPAIVIGHSMGGEVALELAATYPEDVSAICLIDSVLFPSESFTMQLRRTESQLAGPNYLEVLRRLAGSFFIETDDPGRKVALLSKMERTPQHVAVASFRSHLLDYDFAAAAAACKIPTAYLGATTLLANLEEFRKHCPQVMTGQVLGSGHFSPLEVPEQINSMLDHYLKILRGKCTPPPRHHADLSDQIEANKLTT
jgi:pimeloyl-ACP methyl ester carboxylesterase